VTAAGLELPEVALADVLNKDLCKRLDSPIPNTPNPKLTELTALSASADTPDLGHLGAETPNQFKDLPAEGTLLPNLSRVRAVDRAPEFG
jgi:hypothetical protein